jgi:gamma-carbonic anhydrase
MLYEYKGIRPELGENVFLAPGVVVLGDVKIGDNSNIWFNTVLRADVNSIRIGARSNIQDLCMLHVTSVKFPLTIGDDVIVGHRVVLHGCTIHDRVLIGIGALVLDGAVIEEGAVVAAGAVVTPGTIIPANKVAMGMPARPKREPTEEEKVFHMINSGRYQEYGRKFNEIVKKID